MQRAVIVSTARTPFAKSWKGGFNITHGAALAGHVVASAVQRAGIDPDLIEDVVLGCANPEGATGGNLARQSAIRANLPVTVAGVTVNRFCASGLQAIAWAGQRIMTGEAEVLVAGGAESISCVQNEMNQHMVQDPWILEHKPELYWPMVRTAETVAQRFKISREAQDLYGVQSQMRAWAAQQQGLFSAEIAPMRTLAAVIDANDGMLKTQEVSVALDEGIRPETRLEDVSRIRSAIPGGCVSAGNASQFSDGAGACVMMSDQRAATLGLTPLGMFIDFAVIGCEPDEMGIGPVFAVPRLLARHGLTVADVDLWELNEAFAVQVLYCRDRLGIDDSKLNVNGGSIALGHPYGASGARMIGHLLIEGKRRGARYAVATMCIGGGQGAAALFEIT
ncbi:acetyl-CoA C-acyltransferase [Pseudomonas sp. NPDC089406]|uniref:acetyl-CoA C-acyltransferase n=1 Tax=Pseudomonas sp. NPDC089406 TaxID=3364463 RepID=UPI00384E2AB7